MHTIKTTFLSTTTRLSSHFSSPLRLIHPSFIKFNPIRAMTSHIVGYPRIGPKRELKFALESFWDKMTNAHELEQVAKDLRVSMWKQMASAGIKFIPSNTFSLYDQVLDATSMLGAVPPRYGWSGGEIGLDVYFSMARGNATLPAMEMTKWFDTNYHYIVPELSPDMDFTYASHMDFTYVLDQENDGEVLTEASKLNRDQEYADSLMKLAMTEGKDYHEDILAKVFDHLNEHPIVARGFLSKPSEMRKKWLKEFQLEGRFNCEQDVE